MCGNCVDHSSSVISEKTLVEYAESTQRRGGNAAVSAVCILSKRQLGFVRGAASIHKGAGHKQQTRLG